MYCSRGDSFFFSDKFNLCRAMYVYVWLCRAMYGYVVRMAMYGHVLAIYGCVLMCLLDNIKPLYDW